MSLREREMPVRCRQESPFGEDNGDAARICPRLLTPGAERSLQIEDTPSKKAVGLLCHLQRKSCGRVLHSALAGPTGYRAGWCPYFASYANRNYTVCIHDEQADKLFRTFIPALTNLDLYVNINITRLGPSVDIVTVNDRHVLYDSFCAP